MERYPFSSVNFQNVRNMIFVTLVFTAPLLCQSVDNGFIIDGYVNYAEINELDGWETIKQNSDILIRESNEAFYIVVMSNTYTSVNFYIGETEKVTVLHVSYSLGSMVYNLKGKEYEPIANEYSWKFRDPILNDDTNVSEEKTVSEQLRKFYVENYWTANTMPQGSYREVEALISKRLLPSIDKLFISYLKKDTAGQRGLSYFPAATTSITGGIKIDKDLQNGNLPSPIQFSFQK